MSHQPRRARAVGWIREATKPLDVYEVHRVYEALIPVPCSRCGRTIEPGEHFTRRTQPTRARAPVCRTCAPFESVLID